jgi:hypothetical protein
MARKKDIVSSSFQDDPEADASGSGQGGAVVTIDVAELEAVIERLLDRKFAQLLEKGMFGTAASAAAATPGAPADEPASGDDDDDPDWQSDPASMTIDEQVPPWEQTPEQIEVPMDTQASTVTIEHAGDLDDDLDDEADDVVVEIDDDGFSPTMWERIPVLPGGQSSLLGVADLSSSASSVLVLIDGASTLKGLRTLAPDVSDDEFTAIIEDGVGRGIVVFT